MAQRERTALHEVLYGLQLVINKLSNGYLLQHGFWSGVIYDLNSTLIYFPTSFNGYYSVQTSFTEADWLPTGGIIIYGNGSNGFTITWYNTTGGAALKGIWWFSIGF